MQKKRVFGIAAAILLAPAMVFSVGQKDSAVQEAAAQPAAEPVELHLYAGAGLRVPAEIIIKEFEEATGHKVTVEWAGMGQL
ncbi:MAG: hypothetical protein LBP76_11490, partial [Treponema sp.]|nr:hypothetical protein [Treponema sp.]